MLIISFIYTPLIHTNIFFSHTYIIYIYIYIYTVDDSFTALKIMTSSWCLVKPGTRIYFAKLHMFVSLIVSFISTRTMPCQEAGQLTMEQKALKGTCLFFFSLCFVG